MTSFLYKARKIEDPTLNVRNDHTEHYNTSLSALQQAWSSVTATKKELSNVKSRILESEKNHYSESLEFPPPPSKDRRNLNIERRVVYHDPETKYRKENIPPASYPQPLMPLPDNSQKEDYENCYRRIKFNSGDPEQLKSDDHTGNNLHLIKSNSSLRSVSAKERKSEALKKLKDRINQQKLNLSSQNEESFPEKQQHSEEDIVPVSDQIPQEPMVRKIATAPSAPVYKGFNQPDATFTKTCPTTSKRIQKSPASKETRRNKKTQRQVKIGKAPKKHRVVAPKKPSNAITTTSWRAGLEIQKQVKEEMKQKRKKSEHVVVATSNDDDNSKMTKASKSIESEVGKDPSSDLASSVIGAKSEPVSVKSGEENSEKTEMSEAHTENDLKSLTEKDMSNGSRKQDHDDWKTLQKHDKLSANAKSILAEMNIGVTAPDKENEQNTGGRRKKVTAVVDTGLSKKKSVKRSPPVKRKRDEDFYPTKKNRHYDQSEVQKYMMKQQAERKKQKLEEKNKEKKQRELQEMKMKELYEKQKAAVDKSNTLQTRRILGGTFTKGIPMKPRTLHDLSGNNRKLINKGKMGKSVAIIDEENISRTATEFSSEPRSDTTTTSVPFHSPSTVDDDTSLNESMSEGEEIKSRKEKDNAKAERVAAIRATAAALRERLSTESKRLTELVNSKRKPVHSAVIPQPPFSNVSLCRDANASSPLRESYSDFRDIEQCGISGPHKPTSDSDHLVHSSHLQPNFGPRAPISTVNLKPNSNTSIVEESSFRPQKNPLERLNRHSTVPCGLNYPGIHNLDSQAALNKELSEMELAARKIQALYRGHSVRQSFRSWALPSGRTLHQTLEEARRRAFLADLINEEPVKLACENRPPVKLSEAAGEVKPTQLTESLHDRHQNITTPISSQNVVMSSISEAFNRSKSLIERGVNQSYSSRDTTQLSSHEANFPSYDTNSTHDDKIEDRNVEKMTFPTTPGIKMANQPSDDQNDRLREILEKYKDIPADKYSVINIFTRNYPSLRQQQLENELASPPVQHLSSQHEHRTLGLEFSLTGTDTERLIADAYDDNDAVDGERGKNKDNTSINEYLSEQDLEDSILSQDSTLTPTGDTSSKDREIQDTTKQQDIRQEGKLSCVSSPQITEPKQSYRSLLSPKSKRSNSISSEASEKLFSPQSPSSPEIANKQHKLPAPAHSDILTETESVTSSELSRSPSLFSEEEVLIPVLTSTRRSPTKKFTKETVGENTPLTHNINYTRGRVNNGVAQNERESQKNINFNRGGESRMSPNTLDKKLRAEIYLFDSVGDSLQQIGEMGHIRDVVQAQQETVAIAQVLKNRKLLHQQEIDKMTTEARESAQKSAQDVEAARKNAAEAAANAMKVIAEIKTKAADDIAESTKKLSTAQNEATRISLNAIKETERTRQDAFESYKQSVEKRMANVESVVTAAASAASGAAVEAALKQHRDHLETLRERTLRKVSDSYTSSTSRSDKSSRKSTTRSTSKTADSFSKTLTGDSRTQSESRNTIDSVSEEIPFASSKKSSHSTVQSAASKQSLGSVKSPSSDNEKTDEVLEELQSADHELTEALFSTGNKESSVPEESIKSNYSEEKFYSSFTEDELKREFRQVLPSENHRRRSLDNRDYIVSGNETSSDELVTPRNGQKASRRHTKSPFADHDTFARFTTDMVRQYVHEEELRAKHQAALLALREKAIIEKTKAEVAYLEMQKKALKKKGVDEKMPPIAKKQRALMKKLEVEQAEIHRLKEAHKAASNERLFMLQQEQEIRRIQKSTRKIWNEVDQIKDQSDLRKKSLDKTEQKETSHRITVHDDSDAKSSAKSVVDEKSSLVVALDQKSADASIVEEERLSRGTVPSDSGSEISEASIITARDDSNKENATKLATESDESSKDHTSRRESKITRSKYSKSTSTTTEERKSTQQSISASSLSHKLRQSPGRMVSDRIDDEPSSVSYNLKKLKYMSSTKYLTEREKKLETRKEEFTEIMKRQTELKDWREKIMEEEMRLKDDIKKVLGDDGRIKQGQVATVHDSSRDSTLTDHSPLKSLKDENGNSTIDATTKHVSKTHSNESSIRDEAFAVAEDSEKEESKKISEEIGSTQSSTDKISERLPSTKRTEVSILSKKIGTNDNENFYHYSNDEFEDTTTKTTKLTSRKERRRSEEDSLTEGTSDASDTEQRLRTLENELRRRRTELQKLRKKKEKENLRRKEQELKKELQAVEQQINQESREAWVSEANNQNSVKVSPRVLSPRSSLEKILPEKLKIPSDKESRRSLDFSDKESSSRNVDLSEKEVEQCDPRSTFSNKDTKSAEDIVLTHVSDGDVGKQKNTDSSVISERSNEETSQQSLGRALGLTKDRKLKQSGTEDEISEKINQHEKQDSLDEISEDILTRDQNDLSQATLLERSSSSLSDHLSKTTKSRSKPQVSDIYEDDFFEIESVSDRVSLSIKESLKELESSEKGTEDKSEKTLSTQEISEKSDSDHHYKKERTISEQNTTKNDSKEGLDINREYKKTAGSDNETSPSARYSSKFENEYSTKSNLNKLLEHEKSERQESTKTSISEQLSVSLKDDDNSLSKDSCTDSLNHSRDGIILDTVEAANRIHDLSLDKTQDKFTSKDKSSNSQASTTSQLTTVQPDDDYSKSNLTSFLDFRINDRVLVENISPGVIRYLGKPPFSPVVVAGLELDKPMGTNNGTYQGKEYFSCASDHGFFTPLEKLKLLEIRDKEKVMNEGDGESFKMSGKSHSVDESRISNDEKSSYIDDYESVSEKSQAKKEIQRKKVPTYSDLIEQEKSRKSETLSAFAKEKSREDFDDNGDDEIIEELEFKSSSDHTLSEGEIPSPAKLDIQPLVESITDSIMKSIIMESVNLASPRKQNAAVLENKEGTSMDSQQKREKQTIAESTATQETTSTNQNLKSQELDVQKISSDVVSKKLLDEALNVMFIAMREKDKKLLEQEERQQNKGNTPAFFSLLAEEESDNDDLRDDYDMIGGYDISTDEDRISSIKSVHEQLGYLIGDNVEDELEDEHLKPSEKSIDVKPEVIKVPLNVRDTENMVRLAIDEIYKHMSSQSMDTLTTLKVPESILSLKIEGEALDEQCTQLYKTLVFDMTLYLFREIQEFRNVQARRRPPWSKVPKKTFSKFIRQTHIYEQDMCERISNHVCTCMNLIDGRPTLLELKRKLPLNLSKKDYVDAVLVQELREEEAQWVNYDDDELRVKFQLADNILDDLLLETVNLVNKYLPS